jgi:HAD superfamily hydrolase (TIGR01509 family)
MLRALLFDVDGTLAETEEGHRQAFNDVFATFGIPWRWEPDRYRELLRVTGGKERMRHNARAYDPPRLAMIEANLDALHRAKNARYAEWVKASGGALRPGVRRLIEDGRALGMRLAIVTTTSRANIAALLNAAFGPEGAGAFATVVCGEDVARKKPDPEAYLLALDRLALSAEDCVAFEDSRNGLLAAQAAGLRTIVTPSLYSAHEDFTGAWHVARDLDHAIDGAPMTIGALMALSD